MSKEQKLKSIIHSLRAELRHERKQNILYEAALTKEGFSKYIQKKELLLLTQLPKKHLNLFDYNHNNYHDYFTNKYPNKKI